MAHDAEFLVELGTEELPPRALRRLAEALRDGIAAGLAGAGLESAAPRYFATPRRLAVRVSALARRQPARRVEKRGPPVTVAFDPEGGPTRAAVAFAEGCGVRVDALERQRTDKGEWLLFRAELPGEPAEALLPGIVARALADLPVPRRMRWGAGEAEFVRPVHWIVMLLDERVVDAELLGCRAGRTTRGHRFHAPDPIELARAQDYPAALERDGHVIVAFEARRERIAELATDAARELGGEAVIEPALLDEVTALVEWPVAVTGRFDEAYLELPDPVLIATLQEHQRYFPVRDSRGALQSHFITISNIDSRDPAQVRAGNERVVRPRLADAAFFWSQDRRRPLAARRDALREVVYQKGLGSLFDKSERVAELAGGLAEALVPAGDGAAFRAQVVRAAQLAKTDLLTEMVGEFPELQGEMGFHYARADGEDAAVAMAVREQYLPRHAGDVLPGTPAGRALALAERFDTLAGAFALGKRPSGNKDPFGLRRAALGLVRILIEDGLDIELRPWIDRAAALQPVASQGEPITGALREFVIDRLRTWYLDGQAPGMADGAVTAELFEAVRARDPDAPADFHRRLLAVRDFLQLDAASSLTGANKRIGNILRGAEEAPLTVVEPQLFDDAAEVALHAAVEARAAEHARFMAARDYTGALAALAGLKEPVDHFFDAVMVMTDDAPRRRNRLALLGQLRGMFLDVADLSHLSVG